MKDKTKTKEQLIEELEKLRQGLHLYETVVEKMPLALTIWKLEDLDDPGSFQLISCNPLIERATGAPFRQFVGTTVRETFPSSLETEEPQIYAEAVRTGQVRELPDVHFPGDEQTAAGTYSVTAVPLGDRFVGIFAENITERKRTEEALQESLERLEEIVEQRTKELQDAQEELVRQERLAMLGQLAGGVGHELRNPLGVISNAVYYLQTTLPDPDETTKEYLEMISSEVSHGEKVVSDLLDLSRAKPTEREKIAVSTFVARLLKKQPPPEKVKVTTRIASDLPPVFVDPRQIEQVLTNLVINAYQAMPEGGRLTIEARAEKGQVYLSITDTGCGISQENMERLFEPLFTTKAKGIGLGLAVSKNLVEANGGIIEVETEEGKGSTFTVILPTKEAQA